MSIDEEKQLGLSKASAVYGPRGGAAPDAALIAYTGHPGAFTPEDASANLPRSLDEPHTAMAAGTGALQDDLAPFGSRAGVPTSGAEEVE